MAMKCYLAQVLFMLAYCFNGSFSQVGELREICNMETFEAECGDQEVILLQSARYGRMRLGKCVSVNYGNIGCVTDVLPVVDKRCSGQRTCRVKVPDDTLMSISSCPKDVTPYLETSYICLPVIPLHQSQCRDPTPVVLTAATGHLSPLQTPDTCDVIIRVSVGQRINVTLLDFGTANHVTSSRNGGSILCQKYATIREQAVPKDAVVCSGQQRIRNVFVSEGHEIRISLVPFTKHEDLSSRFVLKYQALGCPVPQLSHNAHVTVADDNAVVTCNTTGEKWYLVCKDAKWVGDIGRCAQRQVQDESSSIWFVLTNDWTTPYGILIVIGLGVALGVVIGVILLVAVLFCMKRHDRKHPPPDAMAHELETDTCALTTTLRKTYCPLPVSHHQSYDDSTTTDSGIYSWNRGRQMSGMMASSDDPRLFANTRGTGSSGMRGTNSVTSVGMMEPASGTFPRSVTNKQVITAKTDGTHVYETPK